MKLSTAQERAKAKLTNVWQSAYDLGETLTTLEALVTKGQALARRESLGSMFSPRTTRFFKLPFGEIK